MRYPASRRGPKCACAALLLFAAALFPPLQPALGADHRRAFTPSINDFGGTGLLQTPNARFPDDGELNLGVSHIDPYTRGFLTLQGLPWLEGTFRYTNIGNRLFGPESFSGTQSFKDRGFDFKLRLIEESAYLPQVAVGLRDVGGTTLFGSEFVVASRRYYSWDFSLGLAWGNAGSRGHFSNPLGLFHDGFKSRGGSEGAGQLGFSFFRGRNVAVFGGIEYLTPVKGLRLKLEYDGNSYQREPLGNRLETALPVNAGAEYDLSSFFRISAAFERGNALMLRGTLHSNLNTDKGVPKIDVPPPVVPPRRDRKQPARDDTGPATAAVSTGYRAEAGGGSGDRVDWSQSVDWLYERLEGLGLGVEDIAFESRSAILRIPAESPGPQDGNLAKAALAVSRFGPAGPIQSVTFIAIGGGREISRTTFKAADLERSMMLTGSPLALVAPPDRQWSMAFRTNATKNPAARPPARIVAPEPHAGVVKAGLETPQRGAGRRKSGNAKPVIQIAAPAATAKFPGKTVTRDEMQQIAERVFAELETQQFKGERLDIDGPHATVYLSQFKYRNPAKAIGRAARAVARHSPDEVEEITVVLTEIGVPVSRTTVFRRDLESALRYHGSPEEMWQHAEVDSAGSPARGQGVVNDDAYPGFGWSFWPKLRQQIGGPDKFYFYQIYAEGGAELQVAPGLTANTSIGINLFNNFQDLQLESDSRLPRVRSDIKNYLEGANQWIETLHADYITKITPDWYGRASAGIFELMFGGVGGEVLYRPAERRWAVGLDMNFVQQRDFEGRIGFQDYNVLTGHLSYYHRLPFHDILAIVRAGRYLAKDFGATLELSRTFDNGLTFGVFATKTNVSAEEFGEGAFDKGFYLIIPIDIFSLTHTRRRVGFGFRPVTRDGGQRLGIPRPLYDVTNDSSTSAIDAGWPEILK